MNQKVLPSLAINDPKASHRICGTSSIYGSGILGFYTRDTVGTELQNILDTDPEAQVRVEPHNAALEGKMLRSTDVEWIINDHGELGVKIGAQYFFLWRGHSLMYTGEYDDDPKQYRRVQKVEFGESLHTPMKNFFEMTDGWVHMVHAYHNNEDGYDNSFERVCHD